MANNDIEMAVAFIPIAMMVVGPMADFVYNKISELARG
ncbi:TMhelix containing protein [Vibrio phage 1.201.B._10N.286.55.F1]|nr:TMhelix containing protein [Vibrio phage 1.201.B._10N.286.55.F1]